MYFDNLPIITDFNCFVDYIRATERLELTKSTANLRAVDLMALNGKMIPIEHPIVVGFFTFKVSLSASCYRVIEIHSKATLEDLHLAIQDIFDFDNDHLYAFYLNGRMNNQEGNVYSDPRGAFDYKEYSAVALSLGELGLHIGQSILYLFDFGDNWEFLVHLTDFSASDKKSKSKYKLIKTVGDAPQQYHWDEDLDE
jgi:hypothetical protein